jgi:hypothetical protein
VKNDAPTEIQSPDGPARSAVAIPTALRVFKNKDVHSVGILEQYFKYKNERSGKF